MFDKIDLQRILTASIGALILSTACLVSAAGPVRAAERQARTIVAICPGTTALAR